MATKRPPGLIYDEADIDAVTRTMLGEAAGEGAEGLAAVAHVLVNRLEKGGYGGSLYKVAHAPKQFSAWNSGALGGNNLVNMSADDPRYQQARAIAEQVLNGQLQDNTGGAVNYFAPAGMTGKKGTRKGAPSWADDMAYTTTIGGHQFYSDNSAAGAAQRLARGPDVASLQQQLASRGFNPGPIDGFNGPKTKAAVRAFQQANGLTVDGIVGPQTMAALNRAGSARPTTLPQPPGGMRPLPTLPPPPPLIPNEMMPERAQFKPLPAPPPLTPQTSDPNGMIGLGNGVGYGPGWQTLNTLKDISAGVYPRPAAPTPRSQTALEPARASAVDPVGAGPGSYATFTGLLNDMNGTPARQAPTPLPRLASRAPVIKPLVQRDESWVQQGPDMAALGAIKAPPPAPSPGLTTRTVKTVPIDLATGNPIIAAAPPVAPTMAETQAEMRPTPGMVRQFPPPPVVRPGAGLGAVAGMGAVAGGANGVAPPNPNMPRYVPPALPRVGPTSPVVPPSPGGFNLGAVLGGLGSNIQGGLTNAGQALTTTASNAIEGTRNAIGTTAQNAGDLLKSELMGTVKGRTLLFNTALGLPAPGSRNPTRYGNTFAERQENARRREAMAYGLPYVPPQTGVRTSLSLRPSSPLPTVPAPRSNRPAPRNTGRWEGVLDEFGMIL